MENRKWDDFGNPIGEDSDSSTSEGEEEPESSVQQRDPIENPVVLPEDKKYYPTVEEVFNSYTKVKHEDEDREDYTKPIIESAKKRIIADDVKKEIPKTTFSMKFLEDILRDGKSVRNIAFVGALGHGKTELIDSLVKETHPGIVEEQLTRRDVTNQVLGEGRRLDRLGWTDRLYLEKRRQMSVSTEVVTLAETDLNNKTYALNIIDTPGHPDFMDQVSAGLGLCDGVAFCVDIMEGVTGATKRLLSEVIRRKIPFFLVLTKIDRMILEAKYPIDFAHTKIYRVIEDVNIVLKKEKSDFRVSPEKGNVVFTAARFSLCFSCLSIGLMYMRKMDKAAAFAQRMWGDFRIREGTSVIFNSTDENLEHPFDKFILEPLYKAVSAVLSEEPKVWSKKLRIKLSGSEMRLNSAPLLRIALSRIYGTFAPLVTASVSNLPPPCDVSTGSASVVARVAKFVPDQNGAKIFAIARVFRGALEPNQELYALSQEFADDRTKNMRVTIGEIALTHCRYITPIKQATPGMIVMISETTPQLTGISVLTDVLEAPLPVIPIPPSLMKVAIEPIDPNAHTEMVNSITKALLVYPGLQTKVASNGEHTLLGPGEIYLDCVLNDIRNSFGTVEVKVSDPFVVFNETVRSKSVTICYADIDEHTSIGLTAEPILDQVVFDLQNGFITKENMVEALIKDGWDQLAAENTWCFGPDQHLGTNILVNETLYPPPPQLEEMRPLIETAFTWATSEGPLCDEPIRGVVFRICDLKNDGTEHPLPPAKIIPAVRKAAFAAFLAAVPRIMEPYYHVEILVTGEAETSICENIVERRRGKIIGKPTPVGGTPYLVVQARIPLIDLFGFETDIRARTNGVAFPLSWFEGWGTVKSNPLDNSMTLRPLEPAPIDFLGRDFVLKTRRRKGLSEDVDLSKYCSPDLLVEIATLSQ